MKLPGNCNRSITQILQAKRSFSPKLFISICPSWLDLRRDYDKSIGQMRLQFGRNNSSLGCSSWKGPFGPQALFVDGNACIGCRECVHHASNTFVIDEAFGSARVKLQYGDDDQNTEVSVDSCPVNCIHWVDAEELPVLEFLIQPQPKKGYGVFGGGWERPANVFTAAKSFNKQLKQQEATDFHQRNGRVVEEETPAQAEARDNTSMNIKMGKFLELWTWMREALGENF
ncbi:Chaperone protein dnaJ [Quillaja saponaria]|uniref:Chaperone protein dnaJ n=1 Tax=Quillaja saponaria TaxID=32244 RepID=A0AAD7Q4A4_QUISA|nr:Chaperone protein dnaJ [Quillaja saponaria]